MADISLEAAFERITVNDENSNDDHAVAYHKAKVARPVSHPSHHGSV